MFYRAAILVFIFALAGPARANFQFTGPIQIQTGMTRFYNEVIGEQARQQNEQNLGTPGLCAEVLDIPGTTICSLPTTLEVNDVFLRAAIYAEGLGGVPSKTVLPRNHPKTEEVNRRIIGHDLTRRDLSRFFEKTFNLCQTDQTYCLSLAEQDFYQNIFRPLLERFYRSNQDFVILGFSAKNGLKSGTVEQHELLHAQYFLNDVYKSTVDHFWRTELSTEERERIRQILSPLYDTDLELLMKNEFQAYLLEKKAFLGPLGHFVGPYQRKLAQALIQAGVPPALY